MAIVLNETVPGSSQTSVIDERKQEMEEGRRYETGIVIVGETQIHSMATDRVSELDKGACRDPGLKMPTSVDFFRCISAHKASVKAMLPHWSTSKRIRSMSALKAGLMVLLLLVVLLSWRVHVFTLPAYTAVSEMNSSIFGIGSPISWQVLEGTNPDHAASNHSNSKYSLSQAPEFPLSSHPDKPMAATFSNLSTPAIATKPAFLFYPNEAPSEPYPSHPTTYIHARTTCPLHHDLAVEKNVTAKCTSHHNEFLPGKCRLCPHIITYAVSGPRAAEGHSGPVLIHNRNPVVMMRSSIKMMAKNLASTQPCFRLYAYTNLGELIEDGAANRFGDSVTIRAVPPLPLNVYDLRQDHVPPNTILPVQNRTYNSISRSKMDIVRPHLEAGEQVMWLDLDTLLIADLSYIFCAYPSFVTRPGFWKSWFRQTPTIIIDSKHFAFGDIWKADLLTLGALYKMEEAVLLNGELCSFDVQSYFGLLMSNNTKIPHNIVDLCDVTNLTWGYSWVMSNRMPWPQLPKMIGVDNQFGLFNTLYGKNVGALSFTFNTYQRFKCQPFWWFTHWASVVEGIQWLIVNVWDGQTDDCYTDPAGWRFT